MSHVEILCYGTPDVHEKFIREINNFKYEHKGPLRKGKIAPTISEVRLYDVRIPEEHVSQFVKDIGAIMPENINKRYKDMGLNRWSWISKLFRIFTPLKKVVPAEKQLYSFPQGKTKGWFYVFCLGKIKDTHMKDEVTKEMKEVL